MRAILDWRIGCIIEETVPVRPLPPAFLPVGLGPAQRRQSTNDTSALDRGVDAMDRVYPRKFTRFMRWCFASVRGSVGVRCLILLGHVCDLGRSHPQVNLGLFCWKEW